MELIRRVSIQTLSNSGITSEQLLCPEWSASERLTITRVTVSAGAVNPRHCHSSSEQVWVALHGAGTLLLEEGATELLQAGDVVRFADGEVHGVTNGAEAAFVYLSVTSPAINFRSAYAKEWGVLPVHAEPTQGTA